MTLISLIILSLSALFVVGFAHGGGADYLTVKLKASYTIDGVTYHPNSSGVKMPRSHAKAIDAEIITQPKPEDTEGVDSSLPEGFPERKLLLGAGLDSRQKVLEYPDLTSIKGIGKATAKKIIEAL